ncbi:MAG: hypothetical protein LAO51_18285 [Acidobacteriia bacterium]|nr:hypothetical protein [Terriglobia bacterium]
MNTVPADLRLAVETVVAEIRRRVRNGALPLVVAVDGRSGSGKSTVAELVAPRVRATIVPTDDFFAASIPNFDWDVRTPAQRASAAIDWRRLRTEAIEPLRAGQPAWWRAFDFGAGVRPDGSYAMQRDLTVRSPCPVVILDGAYSARPELADLIDFAVLIQAPAAVRHERLAARETPQFLELWHARWDEAEAYYFEHVRPPATLDLVLTTGSLSAPTLGTPT